MLSFICKKFSKTNKRKGLISPSSSRMLRTISIHHLECNDYVSSAINQDELLVFKEIQESVSDKPHEGYTGVDAAADFPASHDKLDKIKNHLLYDHRVLKGKLLETRDNTLKLKDKGMANEFSIHAKLFLDTLMPFNSSRKTTNDHEDQNYISSDYVEILQSPTEAGVFTKFTSCEEYFVSSAGILFRSHKMENDSFVHQGIKSVSSSSFVNTAWASSASEGLNGSHDLSKRREPGTVVDQLHNLKQRMKDVIMNNRMEKHRISRDGVLHKIPFGYKSKDKKLKLGDDHASEKCNDGGIGGGLNTPHGSYRKYENKSFQKSRSLNESLDSYSQLFDTLSLNENRKVPERSQSIREDSCLLPKRLGRMMSTPVLRSYSFVQSDVCLQPSKIVSPEPIGCEREKIMRSKSIQEDGDLQEEVHPEEFGRMLSTPVNMSYSSSMVLQSAGHFELTKIRKPEHLGCEIEKTVGKLITDAIIAPILEKNDIEHEVVVKPQIPFSVEEAISPDKFVFPSKESITEMEKSISVDGYKHYKESLITEVMKEEADLVSGLETRTEAGCDVRHEKPIFISSLDLNLVEGLVSSAKALLKDSVLQPICIDSDKQHQPSDVQNNFVCNDDTRSLLIHVDYKDDSVFEFVRYILTKYGYRLLDWETEVSSHELGAELFGTTFEQQLLFDLIREVLLEIYENSAGLNPLFQHFPSKIRSMPEGSYLLKIVWAEISWHLCPPHGLNTTLDGLMAHAFTKNDGWANLHRDAECVALQLEYLILDDLLDESCEFCLV